MQDRKPRVLIKFKRSQQRFYWHKLYPYLFVLMWTQEKSWKKTKKRSNWNWELKGRSVREGLYLPLNSGMPVVFNRSNVYSELAWKDIHAKMLCKKQEADMFRMIPFCIILYVKEHILKCGGIEWWGFRLNFFVFLTIIHVCLLTINMYHFWGKKISPVFSHVFLLLLFALFSLPGIILPLMLKWA